jgi:antitoxin component of RelBE/YafQ-DinJ toxin-antitoxin module
VTQGRKKRAVFQFRTEEEFLAKARAYSACWGISMSSMIKLAMLERMARLPIPRGEVKAKMQAMRDAAEARPADDEGSDDKTEEPTEDQE